MLTPESALKKSHINKEVKKEIVNAVSVNRFRPKSQGEKK